MLDAHPDVDDIFIMMAPGHLDAVRSMTRDGGYTKVRDILEGAETRNETTPRALAALGDEDCKVLLHDAVRPLLNPRIVTDCFAALDTYDAVDVAIPSADTIIEVGDDNTITAIPPRARLRRGQTPQAFRASVIRDAYAKAALRTPTSRRPTTARWCCATSPTCPIWVVAGEERNMKVTEPIDVYLADKLFQLTAHDAVPDAHRRGLPRRRWPARRWWSSAAATASAPTSPSWRRRFGANVATFSRSSTQTHVERRERRRGRGARTLVERFGSHRLRRQHRGRAAARRPASRPRRRRSTPPPRSTTSRRS